MTAQDRAGSGPMTAQDRAGSGPVTVLDRAVGVTARPGVGEVARVAARLLWRLLTVAAVAAGAAVSAALVGWAVQQVSGRQDATWVLGRAAGVTSYLLMVALVGLGLLLSHPWRSRLRRPSPVTRIRVHATLAVFTLSFTVLHVVVLAMDSYAGVGTRGALLPLASTYRPVPVTLGLLGAYAGILAGVTAAFAGRLTARIWWPLHKVSAASLVLVWLHGVLAGSDAAAWRLLYIGTGGALVLLAISRYVTTTPADRVAALVAPAAPAAAVDGNRGTAVGGPVVRAAGPVGEAPRRATASARGGRW